MSELVLTGLDGSNPLAFLAALGTLRGLTLAWPEQNVRMSWIADAAWRPVLQLKQADPNLVLDAMLSQVEAARSHPTLEMADDLTIKADEFRSHARAQVAKADWERRPDPAAYVSAFGCDSICDDKGNIVDTALRTMSGAGHQHFLKTMRQILAQTTREHIDKALFKRWQYDDPLRNLSLRFDPSDDKRYALRWADPSGDPTRKHRGNVLAANALAVLGIPLIVVVPVHGRLESTGFGGSSARDTYWTWPLWEHPASLDVVRSLLALPELQELQEENPNRGPLIAMGIGEVFRSQRLTVGKFRNFTPARAV